MTETLKQEFEQLSKRFTGFSELQREISDSFLEKTREWLTQKRQEIVQDANDRKIVLDYMNLVFDELLAELEK